ncbi:MAG: Mu-like prophage major head subunit gpT family protein [Candidatus Dormibacteraeota bacterium]|nr:Mu-like prophage major head subunit gpT family protein [Candidatus Dormibacteraeota bacterium]
MTLTATRNDLLDIVESYDQADASVEKLFGGEGRSVRRRVKTADYQAQLAEAAGIIAAAYESRRGLYVLKEALTTSDFPLLFGDIIDRQLLANYRAFPVTWPKYIKRARVRDFRSVKRFAINGAEATLATVAQQEEYPESKVTDFSYTYFVKKYGRGIPFSWEDMVNDDLDALKDIPQRFGKAAARTEEKFATQLLFDANGPIATFFSTANHNRVHTENGAAVNNPHLGIAGLQDAYTVLGSMVDTEGEPIVIDGVTLVVPPALKVVAENILNATELWLNVAGGDANQQVHTVNWMRDNTTLAVNPYIPLVASGANKNRSWLLCADPNGDRPAAEMGFLQGHEEPEVFMQQPNSVRVGGGAVDPMDGDFDTDSIRYKVRHVLGGVVMDPRMMVGSNGSDA